MEYITDFEIVELPTKTFLIDSANQTVNGLLTDLKSAIIQNLWYMLQIERYRHIIHSWDYGREFDGLIGKEKNYIKAVLPEKIKEAVLMDTRITSVEQFTFPTSKKGDLIINFTVTIKNSTNVNYSLSLRI